MKPANGTPGRWRRAIKWAGASLCVCVLTIWVASAWWSIRLTYAWASVEAATGQLKITYESELATTPKTPLRPIVVADPLLKIDTPRLVVVRRTLPVVVPTPPWEGGFVYATLAPVGNRRPKYGRFFSPAPLQLTLLERDVPASLSWGVEWSRYGPTLQAAVPMWMLLVFFGVVTVGAWRPIKKRDPACLGCDYSLVGLAPDALCPECGRRRGQC